MPVALKMEEGAMSQGGKWYLEAKKRKETFSSRAS